MFTPIGIPPKRKVVLDKMIMIIMIHEIRQATKS